jgi:hypothetical protein
MAAVAFEGLPRFTGHPLEYAQQLEAAGMPRAQAEVVAKGLTAMFIHNFESLVTTDYLDTRFSEFEARVDLRLAALESRMDLRFAGMETRFARINVLLGVVLAATAIPVLQTVLLWVR